MSIGELYELFYIVLEAGDRVFQFWLSASFAVVVATFFAAERLSKRMYQLITVAYVLVSFNMAYRYVINVVRLVEIRADLIEQEAWYEVPATLPAGIAQVAIFAVGFSGTLYFVWSTYLNSIEEI
jgi:hypothetical protein